jgi:hypothetical protein
LVSKSPSFLVVILIISSLSVAFAVHPATANTQTSRLGFWLQEGDITRGPWQGGYSPTTFFNTMFLTTPYPSSVDVMVFAILQAKTNNQGCDTTSGFIGASLTYWGTVAKMADPYPNIRLVFEIAFDPSNGGSGTYGLSCFDSVVQSLAHYPSVYGLGVEGEYTYGVTDAQMLTAMSDVTSEGKIFVNYYIHGAAIPAGGYNIAHTNFPGGDAGGYDQVGTLGSTGPQTIGLDSGYYYKFQFPGTVTCPIGPSAMNSGTAGWNQCVVSTELATSVSLLQSQRQFLELDPGFSSSGYFTGVSGQSTNQLWDNPALRNWIWTDPSYKPNFILSTSSTPPPVTTTTTASTTTASPPLPPPTGGPQLTVLPASVPYDPLNKQTLSYSITGGHPGLGYSIKIRIPAGNVQVIATGSVDATGSASGTLSDIFDVPNGIFDTIASFANGASSNIVGIKVGPSTNISPTTTIYAPPSTSSTITSASSSSVVVTAASSQATTTLVTTTTTTTSTQTTTTTTANGNVPGATSLQSSTTVSAENSTNHQEQGSGTSSTMGTATGLVLGVTAGMALGLVILSTLGRGIGNFPWRGSGDKRGKDQEVAAKSEQNEPSKLGKDTLTKPRPRLKTFGMAPSVNGRRAAMEIWSSIVQLVSIFRRLLAKKSTGSHDF